MGKVFSKIKEHPIICAIGFLAFMGMPSIEACWSLASDKPMLPTLAKKLGIMNMPDFSITKLFVVSIPIGLGMLVYIIISSKKAQENGVNRPKSVLKIIFNESDSKRTPVVNESGLDRGFRKSYLCNIYNSNEVDSVNNVSVELHYKGKFFQLEWQKGKTNIELSAGSTQPIELITFRDVFPSKEILIGKTNKEFISDYDKKYTFTVVVTGVGQPKVEKDFFFAFTTEGGSYEFKVYEATNNKYVFQEPNNNKAEIIDQLNQYISAGNKLTVKIGMADINQFPIRSTGEDEANYSTLEKEFAEWRLTASNYIKKNIPEKIGYFDNLSTKHINKEYIETHYKFKTEQERLQFASTKLMEEYIERIIKIIDYINESSR